MNSLGDPSQVPTSFRFALCMLLFFGLRPLRGQETQSGRDELAVTLRRSAVAEGEHQQGFWMEGGSAEIGVSLVRGLVAVADATGLIPI